MQRTTTWGDSVVRIGSRILLLAFILLGCSSWLAAGKGKKIRIDGVVLSSNGQQMIVDDLRGQQYVVKIGPQTEIEERKTNFLREARIYQPEDLVRGLEVVVRGRRQESGIIGAHSVKMKHSDLKVASTVEARATEFDAKLAGMEGDLTQVGGQVEELTSTSARVREDVRETRQQLGQVRTDLQKTSMRVDENTEKVSYLAGQLASLDDYRLIQSATILFGAGSVELDDEDRRQLEQLVVAAREHEQGILFEVTGFASADGPSDFNRHLSRRRAESVIEYLVEERSVPLHWFVRPHGFGEVVAVADNSTREGRQANRRAEVRVLLNKAVDEQTKVMAMR